MAYPREISLDAETEERLISYLDEELQNHYMERTAYIDQINEEKKDYWAMPSEENPTFPFVGACNLVIPLTAINCEAVVARTMTTIFGLEEIVDSTVVLKEWADAEKPFVKYMNNELLNKMSLFENISSPINEWAKHGTCVGRVGYEKITRKAVKDIGGIESEFMVTVKDGPVFYGVPLARFLMPFSEQDEQTSPWVGEEHSESPFRIRILEDSGFFKEGTFEKVASYWLQKTSVESSGGNYIDKEQSMRENRQPHLPKAINWVSLECSFDVDGDDIPEEICLHYHRESRTLMSVRYNQNEDLRRSYRHANYIPVEYRWNGVGVAKQTEAFMKEVTTQHRQRIDNATIANCRMIKIHSDTKYTDQEPIYPGKMWFVDDMSQIDTFQLGEVYNSAYNNENSTIMYMQQRTGINEMTLGMPQQGTPGTATSDLAKVQESNKKWDYNYKNVKGWVDHIILDTACVIQQYGSKTLRYADQGVMQVLNLPESHLRDGLVLRLKSAGQSDNKLLDRNNWQVLSQLIQQYYTGIIQLAQMSQDQNLLPMIVQKGMAAATETMKLILQTYDISNTDRYTLEAVVGQTMQQQMGLPPGALPSGNPQQALVAGTIGPQGSSFSAGMAPPQGANPFFAGATG